MRLHGGWRIYRRAIAWSCGLLLVLAGFTAGLYGVAHGLARQSIAAETQVITEQVGARVRACVVTRGEMIRALNREWSLGGLRDEHAFWRVRMR